MLLEFPVCAGFGLISTMVGRILASRLLVQCAEQIVKFARRGTQRVA